MSDSILIPKPAGSLLSLQLQLERADLAQRDEMVAVIARRQLGAERNKRHTVTEIRPLAFPVWFGEQVCLCTVIERFILSHPREHIAETHWFSDVAAARKAYPAARMIDDVSSVAPRLAPGRA